MMKTWHEMGMYRSGFGTGLQRMERGVRGASGLHGLPGHGPAWPRTSFRPSEASSQLLWPASLCLGLWAPPEGPRMPAGCISSGLTFKSALLLLVPGGLALGEIPTTGIEHCSQDKGHADSGSAGTKVGQLWQEEVSSVHPDDTHTAGG